MDIKILAQEIREHVKRKDLADFSEVSDIDVVRRIIDSAIYRLEPPCDDPGDPHINQIRIYLKELSDPDNTSFLLRTVDEAADSIDFMDENHCEWPDRCMAAN
jgi:hypothetical protein